MSEKVYVQTERILSHDQFKDLEYELKKKDENIVLLPYDVKVVHPGDAIPISWILMHDKMPKEGKGHDAIMDMIKTWKEEVKKNERQQKHRIL